MKIEHREQFFRSCKITAAAGVLAGLLAGTLQAKTVTLAGQWRFALDRADTGLGEAWFSRALPDKIQLPGSLPAQGVGDEVTLATKWTGSIVDRSFFTAPAFEKYRRPGNVKVPFWLQPDKYYAGAAWYQRDLDIPADWSGRRVVLFLERAHWETRVWVDARLIGTNNNLSTPHEYDLGQLAAGRHTLSIRVDNRRIVDIGEDSHGISDHTQGNWNGIVGRIELSCEPGPLVAIDGLVFFEDLQVLPCVSNKSATVRMKIANRTGKAAKVAIFLSPQPFNHITNAPVCPQHHLEATIQPGSSWVETECSLGDQVYAWDEFDPYMYSLAAWLSGTPSQPLLVAATDATFGLREISTDGPQITINGRKTFIRGTLECCIFPRTGHPPMEVEEWRRIIRIAKAWGLNLFRFHSYCPPEAAFQAADELGFYFQVETCWANGSSTLGDGKPVDQWVYEETDRILKYYGNHPSFILMPFGNEPGGRNANAYLAKYVQHFKVKDPRRLWTSGSGWPQLPENQFYVTPGPRIQAWGGGLDSRINARPPETTSDYREYVAAHKVPVISHEIGQWCAYPNFEEIPKYTGYLQPKNFEIFRDLLIEHGMGGLAKQFLLASGKLQTLCYKEDIESALRTPGMGGFELLDLHDFPGQGTALVGVLDPFWEEKGYVTAQEYSRFCNATVPLARLKKRVFTTDERLEAEIEVANFGAGPITDGSAIATWHLYVPGMKLLSGALDLRSVPIGNGINIGKVSVDLKAVKAPAQCKLQVCLEPKDVRNRPDRNWRVANDWDIWVYPASPATEPTTGILLTAQFDEVARKHLASGGKLLLTIPGPQVRNFDTAPVKLGFSSIFWNTAWTRRQAPTTLGILCEPKHPALAEFPTDFHSNWQWWYLIHRAGALRLDELPRDLTPIVRVIDDWFTARPLGLIVEGKAGEGKVVVCGFDLTNDAIPDPVSRQMRASLLHYMASPAFAPAAGLTDRQIQNLMN